jgi:hypothetical protein
MTKDFTVMESLLVTLWLRIFTVMESVCVCVCVSDCGQGLYSHGKFVD